MPLLILFPSRLMGEDQDDFIFYLFLFFKIDSDGTYLTPGVNENTYIKPSL